MQGCEAMEGVMQVMIRRNILFRGTPTMQNHLVFVVTFVVKVAAVNYVLCWLTLPSP